MSETKRGRHEQQARQLQKTRISSFIMTPFTQLKHNLAGTISSDRVSRPHVHSASRHGTARDRRRIHATEA
jgi:hypothetical protein